MTDEFKTAMDKHQPDWWITFADMTDLRDYARMCSDGHSGTIKAKEMVRNRVAQALLACPVRAGIEAAEVCGLLTIAKR